MPIDFAILQIRFYARPITRIFRRLPVDQRFNLNAWKALCAVESTGSLSEAAVRLGVDPSAISRLIAGLEKTLGQELICRTERPVVMTQEGRRIAKNAAPVLKAHATFLEQIANDTDTMSGTIKLSIPPNLTPENLIAILADFQAMYPHIDFELSESSLIEECLCGAVDIVVTCARTAENGIHCLAQGRSVYIPVASAAYLRTHAKPVKPQDLIDHTGLIYSGQSKKKTEELLHFKGLLHTARYKNTIETSNLLLIKNAVLNGYGVTTSLPLSLCAKEIASGQLRVILDGWHLSACSSYSVCSSAGWHTRRIRVFIQWFCKRLIEEFEAREKEVTGALGNCIPVYADL